MTTKNIIFLLVIALVSASCSAPAPTPTAIPQPTAIPEPTATPDPCAAENILGEVEKVQALVNDFQDIAYIANFTPQAQLIDPILRLQAVRSELVRLPVPECEAALKSSALDYMRAVINYLAFFMGGETAENVDAGIQNSQQLWQVVVGEFNKVVSVAGVEPQELPELSQSAPPLDAAEVLVSNNGSQSVNVRARPDINASILAAIEPGMAAVGLGRTGAGDWLQVNMNGTVGWVSAEAVSVNVPIIDLPVVEETP